MGLLELGRRHVAKGLVQPGVVEPVDVLQGGQLELVTGLPGALPVEQLGLEQPDGGLGQGVVERVTDRADRRGDPRVGQPFGVADRGVLLGFNRSLQHRLVVGRVGARQGLRRGSSIRGSCVVGC